MALVTHALTPEDLTAQKDRLYATILLNEGVVGVAADSFEVLEDTGSNLNVRVGSGTVGDKAVVAGDSSADQGNYVVLSEDATDTVTLSAGDGSNPRIDLIVIRVQDDEADSGGQNGAILDVVEGTPASSPSAPALPDNCLLLAEVEVGTGVSAITDSDITDMRFEATLRVAAQPVVRARFSDFGVHTHNTQVRSESVNLTIPADWNTYDVEVVWSFGVTSTSANNRTLTVTPTWNGSSEPGQVQTKRVYVGNTVQQVENPSGAAFFPNKSATGTIAAALSVDPGAADANVISDTVIMLVAAYRLT